MKRRIDPITVTGEVFLFGKTLERVAEENLTRQASQPRCSQSFRRRSAIAFMGGFTISFAGVVGAIAFSGNPVVAQITPDATLGSEGSIVTPNANVRGLPAELIEGGATRGANLFHSFEQFNVGNGQRVYFANPTGIENILTRVTGNNLSNILGTLGVDGGANLFLLNPNGIIFGENARLDIAGSFVASTANSLVFENGTQFSATNPEAAPLLTINVTPGLQYGTTQPRAAINNSGNLAVGQNLTLSAGNLDLQGQLQAGVDLTLFAQDTLQVRDSVVNPFIASANGNLLVQGNQVVDIFALNHPNSGLFSGGNMVLRSANTIGGDAHYWSGGSFQIEKLDGTLGNLNSPHDPIILVNGDVSLGDYAGGSLHILAGGSVTLGNVEINTTDSAATTINPNNPNPLLASLASFQLSDGTNVTIDGSAKPTLDIRAGVDWRTLFPAGILRTTIIGTVTPSSTSLQATSANITVNGNITVSQPAGVVLLTNQYRPNQLPGTISTQVIDTSTDLPSSSGGEISIDSRGGITTGNLLSFARISGDANSNAGNGGAITLTAINGNITTGFVESYSLAEPGTSGNGGAITLTATNGSINTDYLKSQSDSFFGPASGLASGNGGAITLSAANDITTGDLFSYSGANPGDAGNGSDITVTTTNGNIRTGTLYSYSGALNGNASNGGAITLSANNGSITTDNMDAQAFAGSGAGNGGKITLLARNDITTQAVNNFPRSFGAYPSNANRNDITMNAGGNILAESLDTGSAQSNGSTMSLTAGGNITAQELNSSSETGTGGKIALTAGSNISTEFLDSSSYENGNGGEITLKANGNITAPDVISNSTIGNGGAIAFTAGGNIRSDYIESSSLEQGNGGNIAMTAGGDITLRPLDLEFSGSLSSGANDGGGGTITLNAGGNILADDLNSSSFENGNGGDIALTAGNTITATSLYTGSVAGNGGNIDLKAIGNISTEYLDSSTEKGNGGEITITSDAGAFSVKDAFISTNTFEQGNAGDIQIDAASVSLSNTDVSTTVTGAGDAGKISIVADDTVLLDKSRLFTSVEPGTTGNGGDINLEAKSVSLTTFSYIDTATFGQGNAGNLLIKAEDSVALDNSSIFSNTTGQGNAGNVTVQARGNTLPPNVTLTNRSNISTAVNPTAEGNGGNISLNARSLLIASGSQIQSRTRGQGNATDTVGRSGNIGITADSVTISGTQDGFLSGVFTSTDAIDSGQGGTINITTPGTLLVTDGGVLSAQTSSTSRGGDILVQANTMELRNGGQLLTSTFSSGQAGDILVDAAERVTITSVDPNFNNRISPDNLAASCAVAGIACNNAANSNVESSTRVPYVSIPATGTGEVNTYTFEVTAGTRAIFDIDNGLKYEGNNTLTQTPDSVNSVITLLDSQGNRLDSSGNELATLGGSGSIPLREANSNPPPAFTESENSNDSFLRYVFTEPGRYSIQVSEGDTGVKVGGTYTLQVSLENPNVTGSVIDANPASGLFARTQGDGAAGNVNINTPQLNVTEGAQVSASTSGSGQGGSLTVTAPQSVTLSGNSQLSVETSGAGQAGDATITTQRLTVNEGARVSATATATATTSEQGGSISVNASQINLSGNNSGLLAETQGTAPAGLLLLQPNTNGQTLTVNLQDEAKISASTSGSGQGGSLIVTAPQAVTLRGNGQLSAETSGTGGAGDVRLNTPRLTVRDGTRVSASTSGVGEGGSLQVDAAESVELSGTSRLSVEATAGGTAGDLTVTTGEMFVQDGAEVTVSSPQGQAGNLTITANSLHLNQGTISAETGKSGAEGGANITLQGLDILFMRNESLISASALGNANGGNVTIDSTLIVATPPQGPIGSDIVANAEQGNGGRVNVTTQGLFGIEFRPQRTPDNDITVSSTFGLSGEYILNSPGIDPSRGLAELPTNVVDATEQIDRRCTPAGRTGERSSFTVTGRGGLPPSPNEPLRGESAIANWISFDSNSETNTSDTPTPKNSTPKQLVEAQGWMINEKGEVILTASAQQVTPQGEWLNSADCK